MRSLMINSKAELAVGEVPEPDAPMNDLLVQGLAVGVCGTDRWLQSHGAPALPAGKDRMVIGHESLGRVLVAPAASGFNAGDLVVGVVRSPGPLPCRRCLAGEPDLCENDQYHERGIRSRDGFAAERYTLDPAEAVRVHRSLGLSGVLVEPTSIVVKAWEHIDRVARWAPARVLVLGAGPIGQLAALASVRRGSEVVVVDKVDTGSKPEQVAALGALYTTTTELHSKFDVVLECTGELRPEAVRLAAAGGTVCLIGDGQHGSGQDGAFSEIARELMVHNKTIFGTISSGRRHYEVARDLLAASDPNWLAALIGPRVRLDDWLLGFDAPAEAIKAVIELTGPERLAGG